MNFKELDLAALVLLWQASGGNPPVKALIGQELQERIKHNHNFSREFFFEKTKIQNHAITVSFIPTSEAYQNYGATVGVDIIFDDFELAEMIENYSSRPIKNTGGYLKATALYPTKNEISQFQIERLKTIGFNTADIFETLSL